MESSEDVFNDWAVAEAGGKTYIGKVVEIKPSRESNYVCLERAFELLIARGMQPGPTGQPQMMQQNFSVAFPLCAEGTTVDLFVTSIRYLEDMNARDKSEHVIFIRAAQAQFAANRAAEVGLVTAGPADLRNLQSKLNNRGNA